MATTYKGYKIRQNKDEKHPGYLITTPNGDKWREIAVNLDYAKRWIDCDIIERQHKRLKSIQILP